MGGRGKSWTGAILDLSIGGVHLAVGRRFEVGSLVTVTIQGPRLEQPAELVMRVQLALEQTLDRLEYGSTRRLR